MAGFSTYLGNAILNWVKSSAFPSDPAAVYVALFDGDPTDAGSGGTEVTTTIRAAGRVAVTFGSITAKVMDNDAEVDFGDADAGADVDYFAIFDASAAGNMLFSAALTTPRTITTGQSVKFPVGDISVDIAT